MTIATSTSWIPRSSRRKRCNQCNRLERRRFRIFRILCMHGWHLLVENWNCHVVCSRRQHPGRSYCCRRIRCRDVLSLEFTTVSATNFGLQEEDTEPVNRRPCRDHFPAIAVAIGMNTTRRPATPVCDRRFERTAWSRYWCVGDVFFDIRVRW